MKKILIIGEHASCKEKLIQLLLKKDIPIRKAMAMNYYDFLVDAPSEFLENKNFFNALITASFSCECILMVININQKSSLIPPNFAPLFQKKVLGIVTYNTVEINENIKKRAERFLKHAGIEQICFINIQTCDGLEALEKSLL